MSLREQWYAARSQRQQEVLERRQQVATFLLETRSQLNEVCLEQRQQRVAYVAAIKNYVWGTTPNTENDSNITTDIGQNKR
ncbi:MULTISPECIES: hypothetical protein [unclassified Nostoc]|uniref:hypothetical protein n=1 Tax=unclassified Nostoc TaxID=2593658 RepID=UPI002AD20262|nr:hypothetical protein [Nostoc sp. DedQUE03]MDZ7976301.1 hypothetical protein [Nostoc sp. DedQUE03]MDZ8044902.1 hypothetical protein [Nostoc sp. DedQUE02]